MSKKKNNLQCEKSILSHIVSVIILSMYIYSGQNGNVCCSLTALLFILFLYQWVRIKAITWITVLMKTAKFSSLIEQILSCYKSF